MLQNTDPERVERQEPLGAEDRAMPEEQAQGPARFDRPREEGLQIEQIAQRSAGVEKRVRIVRDKSGLEHRERTVQDLSAEYHLKLVKVAQITWLVIGTIEALAGLRVLLKLFGANPNNDFARLVYDFSAFFLAPFFGLTGSPSSGSVVLEVPSLIAMVTYGLLGWGIVSLVLPLFALPATRSSSTYDRFRE